MAAAKAAADLGSAAFQQAIVAALLNDKHDDIVKWRGEWLRARHDALAGALRAPCPSGRGPNRTAGSPSGCACPRRPAGSGRPTAARSPRPRSGTGSPWSPADYSVPAASAGDTSQASEYLRLAFTQAPDVLAGRPWPWRGPAADAGGLDQGGPISPFLVTRAASSSAASPPVPAGRAGSTM